MAKKQILIQPKSSTVITNCSGYGVSKPKSAISSNHNSPLSSASSLSSPTDNNDSTAANQQLDPLLSNNIIFNMPLIPDQSSSSFPRPKILKSCIRCRKHKTKCDASEKTPNPCSSCAKKGIQCKIDYVLPPQRSDNLKNLVGHVETIKTNYELLENYYTKISSKLNIKVESFEDWKAKVKPQHVPVDVEDDSQNTECESKSSYNLIKLSDGSFISMNLIEDNKLLINNKIIDIDQFQEKLRKLSTRLSFLHKTTKTTNSKNLQGLSSPPTLTPESGDESTNCYTDDNSSIASPISVLNNSNLGIDICQLGTGLTLPQKHVETNFTPVSDTKAKLSEFELFDLKFDVLELFSVNKFLLILLVGFYYPDTYNSINGLNYNLFLSDYLNSYYQIIENQNRASNSSTYSSFLINSIPGYHLVFNKDQLKDLIDCEIFNSEVYLKKIIQVLFLNVLIYGLDEHFKILKDFIKFVEKNINSNRKKINFEKNEDLKFIDRYIKLFDIFENTNGNLSQTTDFTTVENFKTLLSLNLNFTNSYQFKDNYYKSQSLFSTLDDAPAKNNNSTMMNSMKGCFQKFIADWSSYFQLYESELGLFIDDFIVELFIINCLIFINEGHQDFSSVLLDVLNHYKITNNESIMELIEFFKAKTGDDGVAQEGDSQQQPTIEHFSFSCFQLQHIIMNLILNKKNSIELKINDIQVILENVDWKKESTDDVLKKIGVI